MHREHPATLEVHDAVYSLLTQLRESDDDGAVWRAVDDVALAARLDHPLRAALSELVGQTEPPETRTLQSVLAGVPGLPIRDDPLEVLELHLHQQQELQRLLEQRQEELVRNVQRLTRLLNLTAGVAVLLFILAGLGWAVAHDWLSVIDEPGLEDLEQDEDEEERARPEGPSERSERR